MDGKRIPALDGIRSAALLGVVSYHFSHKLDAHGWQGAIRSTALSFGWTGVDLFFVLSGFLITGILLDSLGDAHYFRTFYARRALRIFPLYYFSLVVLTVLFRNPHLAWYAIYAQDWIPSRLQVPQAGVFWSLAIEEQFYLVWPLIVYLFPKRVPLIAIAGIAISNILRPALLVGGVQWEAVYSNPFTRMDAILAGCLAAWVVRSRRDLVRPWMYVAPFVALVLMRLSPVLAGGTPMIQHLAYPLVPPAFAGLICAVVVMGGGRILSSAPLLAAGKYSYSVYVWHLLIGRLIPASIYPPFAFALAFAASFGVAAISYRIIERPFLRLKVRFPVALP